MRMIVTFTVEDGSRESGSVYYSPTYLVESDTLLFDEPVFNYVSDAMLGTLGLLDDEGDFLDMEKVPNHLRSLGYTVHDIKHKVVQLGDDQ